MSQVRSKMNRVVLVKEVDAGVLTDHWEREHRLSPLVEEHEGGVQPDRTGKKRFITPLHLRFCTLPLAATAP